MTDGVVPQHFALKFGCAGEVFVQQASGGLGQPRIPHLRLSLRYSANFQGLVLEVVHGPLGQVFYKKVAASRSHDHGQVIASKLFGGTMLAVVGPQQGPQLALI